MQHVHLVTLLDLTLTLNFTYYKNHTYNLRQPLRSLWAKFEFVAIISHIPVADNAKSDRFDLWPYLDLVVTFLNLKLSRKVLVESFCLPSRQPRYGPWFMS